MGIHFPAIGAQDRLYFLPMPNAHEVAELGLGGRGTTLCTDRELVSGEGLNSLIRAINIVEGIMSSHRCMSRSLRISVHSA